MKNLIAIFLSVFGFYYTQVAFSANLPAPYVGNLNSAGAMVYYGSAAYTKAQKQMGIDKRWNSDILASTQSGVRITQNPKIPTAAGETAIAVSGLATAANVFLTTKTIAGAVIGGPVGIGLTALTLAPAIVDYFNTPTSRLGPESERSSPLPFEVLKKSCPVGAVCVEFHADGDVSPGNSDSMAGAAGKLFAYWKTLPPRANNTYSLDGSCVTYDTNIFGCPYLENYPASEERPPGWGTLIIRQIPGSPVSMNWTPASWDEIESAMQDRSAALTPGMIDAILEAGGEIPLDSPVASGPASVSGVPTVKTNNDGTNTTKETTTPKTNLEYSKETNPQGKEVPKITTSTSSVTITNVTNNSTGVTTTTNTSTVEAPDTPKEDYSFANAEFPPIPDLYERKYPDGFQGVWDDKIAGIKASPLFRLVDTLMPANIPTSGSCPAFLIPLNLGPWGEYGNLDFSPPCFVWPIARVIILISAFLLARRLIFGG